MITPSRSGFRDQGHGVSCPVLANGSGKGSCFLGCFHWWLFLSIRECWAGVRATGQNAWIWRDSGLKPDFAFLVSTRCGAGAVSTGPLPAGARLLRPVRSCRLPPGPRWVLYCWCSRSIAKDPHKTHARAQNRNCEVPIQPSPKLP